MRKPRRKPGAPRVRQVNGRRFLVARYFGGWWAGCRYSDALGHGHRISVAVPSGHPGYPTARRGLLAALHEVRA